MKQVLKRKQDISMGYFGAIKISLSSPEKIRALSYGEVKKTETLNYKTLRPERDGLFCEKIFGPVRDYECSCGRYKKSPTTISSINKKIVCDRCGVEITSSSVRRERMGHINLVVPIAHYWFFGKSPSKIALVLDMNQEDVKNIIYGVSWVVVEKLDNLQDVLIRVLEKIKNEILEVIPLRDKKNKEIIEEFWNKIIESARNSKTKLSFDRKFVLNPKNINRYLQDNENVYEFIKEIKKQISNVEVYNVMSSLLNKIIDKKIDNERKLYEGLMEIISHKLMDAITDDERYVGNLSNNKNYLTAKVLTNAEAIWRLLRDEDLKEALKEIKEELKRISDAENIMRIKNLFNIYISDLKKFSDDINKIELIIKHLKDSKLLKLLEKKDTSDADAIQLITELSNTLVEKSKQLPLEVLEILYELFGKYNIEKTTQIAIRSKLITRFKTIESFISNNIRPEWMVLQVLPVLPPDLRPLVVIEGGKFASSDLNELYRRVIHRNNRLKKFCSSGDEKEERKELFKGTPKLIILNEKRLLQEAVDALIENSARKNPIVNSQKRPLKSLTDILKGKQGRFRQNLLGKRVDYSGRSVIVVGPELKLYQCGLPKEMAFELFKPYLFYKIMKKYNVTLKKAKLIAEKKGPEVWDILEEIIKNHPVLLNRAPTLHRPSIEAFEPVLVEGKSIKIHPMVCTPFNADFDGDQMAVFVPLTLEAIAEAKLLMMSYHNLFSPANGKALIGPTQDIVLGVGYLTSIKSGEKGEGYIFGSAEEALYAYNQGFVNLNAKIKVRGINNILVEGEDIKDPSTWKDYTSVGRIIFNDILPEEIRFKNYFVGKKELFNILQECYQKCGGYRTVVFLDDLKKLGYHYATICGFTISIDDMLIPKGKEKYIEEAQKRVKEIEKQAKEGIITEKERYNSIIDIWSETIEKITEEMKEQMKQQGEERYSPDKPRFNSVYFMAESGARGNMDQVKQLSAIRGLMSRPQRKISGEVGEIIETPVLSNFREGLSILEYFISTHGGRKGLSDTALKTSEAGYLTRRLIDVAHHVVVTEEDCGTLNRIKVSALKVGDEVIESLKERIVGRVAADNISYDIEEDGKVVTKTIKAGEMITEQQADEIVKSGIYESIPIRSVLTCESKNGVCAKCYGMDLSTGELVKVGEAVGIVAAQSIGEPGTQLTLRTFHIGGAAATLAKKSSIRAPFDGKVEYRAGSPLKEKKFEMITKYDGDKKIYIVISSDASIRITGKNAKQDWRLPYGSRIYVEDGQEVKKDQLIADWDAYSIPVVATKSGKIKYSGLEEGKTYVVEHRASGIKEMRVLPSRGNPKLNIVSEEGEEIIASYNLPADSVILVENGEKVKVGDVIAKIPREEIKTRDITAGLPRIEELFEARHPQNSAILSEIDGVVHIKSVQRKDDKGKEETDVIISVVNEKTKHHFEYKIPPGRFPLVHEGDNVEAGEPLTDGIIDPHKYLAIRGSQHLQEFLLNEIQGVYRLQGVNINDKHIEIIIRQMLSFVRIVDPGVVPTDKSKKFYEFIYGEIVPKKVFKEEIEKYEELIDELKKQKKYDELKNIRVPKAEPILLGITAVASASESFLSAASFQETSRILTQAAIECRVDTLSGLKENVIIGRLIPCGTGFYGEEAIALRKEEKIIEKLEV